MTKFAVAILVALTMPARAEDLESANFYLPGCKGFIALQSRPTLDGAWRQGQCVGFIDGLMYGVGGTLFCPPKGGTTSQGVAVIVKYIEARPERMHERFSKLVAEALITAWPCKR
jgi:Rap1a immunity proteins